MTVYAYKTAFEDQPVIAIVAADTIGEMNDWWKVNEDREDLYLTDILMDHLSDDELRMFKRPIVMMNFSDEDARDKTSEDGQFEMVPGPNAAKSCQEDMILEDEEVDEYSEKTGDRRTIAEVTGTAKDDKWDKVPGDVKSMKAPEGVTGDGGQGGKEGKLKKTPEQLEEDRQKIVERKTAKIMLAVREGHCSTHVVHELTAEMEADDTISGIVAKSIRNSVPKLNDSKKKVKRLATAEMRQMIEELNSAIVNTAQEVIDADANSIGIIRNEVDAQGNIQITAIHRSAEERAEALKSITEMRAAFKKQEATDKLDVISAAKKADIDTTRPNTVTSLLPDGRVAQEHTLAKVAVIVSVDDNERKYFDSKEGSEITLEQYDEKIKTAEEVDEADYQTTIDSFKDVVAKLDEAVEGLGEVTGRLPDSKEDKAVVDSVLETIKTPEPEEAAEEDADPVENPENWVFAVVGDEDNEKLVILTRDYWEKTGKLDDPANKDVDWLHVNSFRYRGNGEWEYVNSHSIEDGRNRLIKYGCVELPALTNELDEKYDWPLNKRGHRLFKDEEKAKNYYFAICPPDFFAEEETIFGTKTWVVMFPRKRFDAGENPAEQDDSISEKTLTKYGWESHGKNVYSVEASAGQVAVSLLGQDSKEDGRLLYRMGLDADNVAYDWPFHYKDTGTRKSSNDFRQEAIRILEIARKQGIVLEDETGTVSHAAPLGVDQDTVGNEDGDDITEDVLGLLGTSLEEEKAKREKKEKEDEDDK